MSVKLMWTTVRHYGRYAFLIACVNIKSSNFHRKKEESLVMSMGEQEPFIN